MSRTKEEAIAAGITIAETRHNMQRRKPWHDYRRRGTYMLTLVVNGRSPLLGRLVMPTLHQEAHVEMTELGKAIYHEEVLKICHFYKMVEVWKLCIMPDHIHMIVRVRERRPVLFQSGYNDQILLEDGQLSNWLRYLDDNPKRLAIKRLHPDYFTTMHYKDIAEWHCQLVGNSFLLDIPDMAAVIVHSAYSDKKFEDHKQQWLACGERGGVLVSTSIVRANRRLFFNLFR